ncbi:hypothetical protein PXNS11_290159 [Stutzerimonas xanthomarina]|nr:hypothetical protein PXNS11_290159 [Stutzerimonas xanthomarina]
MVAIRCRLGWRILPVTYGWSCSPRPSSTAQRLPPWWFSTRTGWKVSIKAAICRCHGKKTSSVKALVLARRHITGEQIILEFIARNRVRFRRPGTKIDKLATIGTERPAWALRPPLYRRSTRRTLNYRSGHTCPPRNVK